MPAKGYKSLTVREDVYELISRLSEYSGLSRARVVEEAVSRLAREMSSSAYEGLRGELPYRPLCPCCGNPLSFIVKNRGGEILITIDCEWCDEYHGLVLNTHLTEEDLRMYKDKFLPRPRPWLVEIEQ